jgi:hypothetical protein
MKTTRQLFVPDGKRHLYSILIHKDYLSLIFLEEIGVIGS